MRIETVPSSWLLEEGYRLDPRPYVSGSVATRKRLDAMRTTPLCKLTAGFKGGIFTHLFSPKRTYVEDPAHGFPFLGASAILRADLSRLPLLSKRDAFSRSYRPLEVKKGMTLISCSGVIGRMTYVRDDMDGMWSSGDTLKIVPDSEKIPPGYLFAFLASRFGVPMVAGGTYGTIVQHLEPQHVATLPVPRLANSVEEKAHSLVEQAATSRTEAVRLLADAQSQLGQFLGSVPASVLTRFWTTVPASALQSRCDAFYFSAECLAARQMFDGAESCEQVELSSVCEVFIPGIFKRKYADDPAHGYPYVTGVDVFQLEPTADRHLRKDVAESYGLVVHKGTILVQEAGQIGGLIGRSVLVGRCTDGFAVSNNMVRITPSDPEDAGYVFAVLASDPGATLLARESAGSSIPHLEVGRVRRLRIPWAGTSVRRRIGSQVCEAISLRDTACDLERAAKQTVEHAIEEAS